MRADGEPAGPVTSAREKAEADRGAGLGRGAGNEEEGRSAAGPPSSGPRPERGGKKWAGSRDGLKMKNMIFFK